MSDGWTLRTSSRLWQPISAARKDLRVVYEGETSVSVRPNAFARLVTNLASNAAATPHG